MPKPKYQIGNVVRGEVTGIQNYGVFIKIDDNTQGLVHISEVNHGYVKNLQQIYAIGDKVIVQIIDIDPYTEQISLSLRSLINLSLPHYPARSRISRYVPLEENGFQTLKAAMPQMIAQAEADIAAGNIIDYKNYRKDEGKHESFTIK